MQPILANRCTKFRSNRWETKASEESYQRLTSNGQKIKEDQKSKNRQKVPEIDLGGHSANYKNCSGGPKEYFGKV